ncbi:MAG: DUF427 domain-containing protein [Devosiaceae bacterium]|nr:DUF427 domain-containing protein [Devosiaceae bacterium MH13]
MSETQTNGVQGTHTFHPFENVRDYPRPPALERVSYPISIAFGGQQIVSTTGAYRVLETFHPPTYYIPPEDIAEGVLHPIRRRSLCEWKGPAKYYDVRVGDASAPGAAWCYPDPVQRFMVMADYVAFYCHEMDRCLVDGVEAEPQPGNFYGGWVSPWIGGPIKGAPGTNHW